jgi:hypothetical protein
MRASLLSFGLLAFLCSEAVAQIQASGPVQLDSGKISGSLTGKNNSIFVYKGMP